MTIFPILLDKHLYFVLRQNHCMEVSEDWSKLRLTKTQTNRIDALMHVCILAIRNHWSRQDAQCTLLEEGSPGLLCIHATLLKEGRPVQGSYAYMPLCLKRADQFRALMPTCHSGSTKYVCGSMKSFGGWFREGRRSKTVLWWNTAKNCEYTDILDPDIQRSPATMITIHFSICTLQRS